MKIKSLLYIIPLILSGCASSPERYKSWQMVNQSQIRSVDQRYLADTIVKVTEIKERNKTARSFSPKQSKADCEKKIKHQQNISGRGKRKPGKTINSNYKGGLSPADRMFNSEDDMVLEGMDIMTSQLSKLIEMNQGNHDCEDDKLDTEQGSPVTINANGATGGITINIGSPGAVATTNSSEKKKDTKVPMIVNKPPKSDLQSFWDNLFGFGNNTVNAIANKADVLSLGYVAARQASRYSHYEDNNSRREYFDYSDKSDNSIVNGVLEEE